MSVGYHAAGTTAKPYAGLVRVFNRQINSLQFTCADIGQHWVTLWVADSADNTDQQISSIYVVDSTPPILQVQDAFLYPDTGTTITISLSDVLLGSYDNCGMASITFSDSIFSLADPLVRIR